MKTAERYRARELRTEGWSVREIERELQVSRASVSVWVRDIVLTPEQRQALEVRSRRGPLIAGERSAVAARQRRLAYQNEGRELARRRGRSYAAGCMLYWAEGAKGRNSVKITNSDPDLLVFFAQFLRDEFDVTSDAMKISCNLFADHVERQREIEDYWLERLGLTRASLRKTIVNSYSKYSQKKRIGKLPFGTCALYTHSTRIVQTIYGSIQEYGGFDRPAWLD